VGLRCVLPHLPQSLVSNGLTADEPVDHVLVPSIGKLDDHVVHVRSEARISDERTDERVLLLVAVVLAERHHLMCLEGLQDRSDGFNGHGRRRWRLLGERWSRHNEDCGESGQETCHSHLVAPAPLNPEGCHGGQGFLCCLTLRHDERLTRIRNLGHGLGCEQDSRSDEFVRRIDAACVLRKVTRAAANAGANDEVGPRDYILEERDRR
jgi:hypothetical protein